MLPPRLRLQLSGMIPATLESVFIHCCSSPLVVIISLCVSDDL